MAPSTVFLLTNVYPFAKGEEFIENEIGHLAEGFDRVVVIACQPPVDAEQTRTVPDNCVVLRAGRPRPSGTEALKLAAATLPALLRRRGGRLPVRPRHLADEAVFEGRARDSMRELAPQLDTLGLRDGGEAVVYSYWLHVTARAGMLLADELRRRGTQVTKLVTRAHRYDLYPEESALGYIPARELLLGAYDAIHPVSDHGTELLRDSYPEYAAKVSTRRLGTRDPGALVECRQDPARLVSCSFILPVKRVDRFVGVLQQAEAGGTEASWTHFGSGDALASIQRQADDALGAGRADLAGYVANAELPDRYRQLHPTAFVNLSESEGVPVTIMEAIALGIPVIATAVGGVAEIVRDGENGYLLPRDFDDNAAAGAVNKLAKASQQSYEGMCRRARELWQDEFDEAKVYPAFVAELLQPAS